MKEFNIHALAVDGGAAIRPPSIQGSRGAKILLHSCSGIKNG
jgi:hypothetical protein